MSSFLSKLLKPTSFSQNVISRFMHSKAPADLIRTVDVSQIAQPFTDQVSATTYALEKEVKAGKLRWREDILISDKVASKLGKILSETISTSQHPQKAIFEKSVQDFHDNHFLILLLKGLKTEKIELPSHENISEVFKNQDFRIASNVFTGFILGPLSLNFQYGQHLQRLRPISPKYYTPRNSFDTTENIGWHIDNSSQTNINNIPDCTSLYCVQNKEGISTGFLSAKTIFESIDDKYKQILMGKNFMHISREEYYDTKIPGEEFAIFSINKDNSIGIQYDSFGSIEGCNVQADQALRHLEQRISELEKTSLKISLESGDLITFKNSPAKGNLLHSRDKIPNSLATCNDPFRRLVIRTDININKNTMQK